MKVRMALVMMVVVRSVMMLTMMTMRMMMMCVMPRSETINEQKVVVRFIRPLVMSASDAITLKIFCLCLVPANHQQRRYLIIIIIIIIILFLTITFQKNWDEKGCWRLKLGE